MDREQKLYEIAQDRAQNGYEEIAINEIYPGIFQEGVEQHQADGKVDILLEDAYVDDHLNLIEVAFTESEYPPHLHDTFRRKQEKAEKNREFFEKQGFNVDTEVYVQPEGNLKAVYEIFEETTGIFTWGQAVDAVSEPGRLGNMEGEEIIYHGKSSTGSELYGINEEYDELIDCFRELEFYP